MLSFIIFVLVPVLLYELVKYLSEIHYKKRIKNSTSCEEANSYRNKIKSLRITVFTVYWLLFAVVIVLIIFSSFLSLSSTHDSKQSHDLLYFIAGLGYMLYKNFLGDDKLLDVEKEFGNIAVYSKDEIINYRYAFYLRAFDKDRHDYLTDKDLTKREQQKKFYRFEEYEFCSTFEKNGLDLYAIGNPKETDAPQGARRIYVNHDTWQADVKELIAECQMLFILMSSRDSCIWEIEQTPDYLHKTIFLVDNIKTYEECINRVEQMSFPHLEKEGYYAIYKQDSKWQIMEFENSLEGYQQLASQLKSEGLFE